MWLAHGAAVRVRRLVSSAASRHDDADYEHLPLAAPPRPSLDDGDDDEHLDGRETAAAAAAAAAARHKRALARRRTRATHDGEGSSSPAGSTSTSTPGSSSSSSSSSLNTLDDDVGAEDDVLNGKRSRARTRRRRQGPAGARAVLAAVLVRCLCRSRGPTSSSSAPPSLLKRRVCTQATLVRLAALLFLLVLGAHLATYLFDESTRWPDDDDVTRAIYSNVRAVADTPAVRAPDGRTYRGKRVTLGGTRSSSFYIPGTHTLGGSSSSSSNVRRGGGEQPAAAAAAAARGAKQMDAFLGIKYADKPRRFRDAKPRPRAQGMSVSATEWNRGCPRYTDRKLVGVEDCLALNVFAPTRRSETTLLPVIFWIHGGGFATGASQEWPPDGIMEHAITMNRPVIFVSINYRLGVLGFSAEPPRPGAPPHPPHIPLRAPDHLDLNVGLKDQALAARWVKDNIVAWGGDPERIVAVGHSAGAISVGLHLIYSDQDFFNGAFMLSGAPTSFPVPWPHDAAARTIHPLPGHVGCPAPEHDPSAPPGTPPDNSKLIDCMRRLPMSRLMQGAWEPFYSRTPSNGFFPWYPVLEGDWNGSWLDVRPSERIARGTFDKVPLILGTTTDEGTRFVEPDIATQEQISSVLRTIFDFTFGAVETILEPIWDLYPDDASAGSPFGSGLDTFGLATSYKRAAAIVGDVLFQAPRRFLLRETPKDWGEDSWGYFYDETKVRGAHDRFGVQHGADTRVWFGQPDEGDRSMRLLSKLMRAYMINFVHNLDPNGPGLRPWPKYGPDRHMLYLARRNVSLTYDNDRLEPIKLMNDNNPIFAR